MTTATRRLPWAVTALLAALLAVLLAGCAAPDRVPLGSTREATLAHLGTPTAVHRLVDGERLQYSLLPAGPYVHNLDFDANGRLQRNTQVMDPADFGQIEIDRWTRAEVLLRYGRPALVEQVASFQGDIWTYRFLEITRRRMLHIHIDPAGVVRRWMTSDEPEPDDRSP